MGTKNMSFVEKASIERRETPEKRKKNRSKGKHCLGEGETSSDRGVQTRLQSRCFPWDLLSLTKKRGIEKGQKTQQIERKFYLTEAVRSKKTLRKRKKILRRRREGRGKRFLSKRDSVKKRSKKNLEKKKFRTKT